MLRIEVKVERNPGLMYWFENATLVDWRKGFPWQQKDSPEGHEDRPKKFQLANLYSKTPVTLDHPVILQAYTSLQLYDEHLLDVVIWDKQVLRNVFLKHAIPHSYQITIASIFLVSDPLSTHMSSF